LEKETQEGRRLKQLFLRCNHIRIMLELKRRVLLGHLLGAVPGDGTEDCIGHFFRPHRRVEEMAPGMEGDMPAGVVDLRPLEYLFVKLLNRRIRNRRVFQETKDESLAAAIAELPDPAVGPLRQRDETRVILGPRALDQAVLPRPGVSNVEICIVHVLRPDRLELAHTEPGGSGCQVDRVVDDVTVPVFRVVFVGEEIAGFLKAEDPFLFPLLGESPYRPGGVAVDELEALRLVHHDVERTEAVVHHARRFAVFQQLADPSLDVGRPDLGEPHLLEEGENVCCQVNPLNVGVSTADRAAA